MAISSAEGITSNRQTAHARPALKIDTTMLLRGAIGILAAAFIGILVFSLRDTSAREGQKAPPFTIVTDSGNRITPDSFGGKVLVLNFWASWCAPCVEEVPSLSEMSKKFGKSGIVVVAISTDKHQEKYRNFLNRVHASFQTAWDPKSDISSEYGTYQIPESYIIKNGRVLRKFAAAEDWTSDDMTQYLQSLL